MEKAHELDKERADDTLISGRVDLGGLPGKMFQPFGLESRFALAAGLAVRGLLPGIKSVEFLSQERAEKHKSTLARSLLNRTVLVCGVLTLLLLVLPFLASLYVEERTSELDEELARVVRSVDNSGAPCELPEGEPRGLSQERLAFGSRRTPP
jgi:ABC-type phosphate transport system permease subunit